jgi:hypothetical protein
MPTADGVLQCILPSTLITPLWMAAASVAAALPGYFLLMLLNAVNDPPSFVSGSSLTAPANAGSNTFAGWASSIYRGPYEDGVDTFPLQFNVCGCTNTSGMLSAVPTISGNGMVKYRLNGNPNPSERTATCQVTLVENRISSARQALTITRKSCLLAEPIQHTCMCSALGSLLVVAVVPHDVPLPTHLTKVMLVYVPFVLRFHAAIASCRNGWLMGTRPTLVCGCCGM